MTFNDRQSVIKDLENFIADKVKILSNVITPLNWDEESLTAEEKVQCPHNPNHWIPKSSLFKHREKCSWLKEGYVEDEFDKQLPDSDFFYQNAPSVVSVSVDKNKQLSVLMSKGLITYDKQNFENISNPKTVDRWTTELNPEQRLAIYDHIVEEGKLVKQPTNVPLEDLMFDFETKNDQGDKVKTHLEILAEQRDYKRRRQSYRAKNVHITKKSYTEELKEVIEKITDTKTQESAENEMERPEPKYSENGTKDQIPRRHGYDRRHGRDSRSRSRSRTPKKHKHKHKRSRSRSRERHKHKKSHKHKNSKD
uniref:U11/U12 small nuclear ribonucleoprotein n=1 Tax=Parasteatoda tepidariorum TaxID=114398 RepID=A0A2L2YF04_PARTP